MTSRNYCVYQAVNARLREAVVGVSDTADLAALKDTHARLPPVWIGRWPAGEADYRILETGLSLREAVAAAQRLAGSAALKKYKVRVVG